MWTLKDREQRRHNAGADDQRTPFARDRDRILYSSAFRRLAGVTQIVRAGEADVFHTRQQHTLKVAQVGRRIAENLLHQYPALASTNALDPDVVEAACLAHDLGHPPFGHIGEQALDKCLDDKRDCDGYEGNAQSFRILTRLSVRFTECRGLDLTRATLAACLKYPWFRDRYDKARSRKWGAYYADEEDFNFVKKCIPLNGRTIEAEIMDWADDIAYSIHDLEDFHRCGIVPWVNILEGEHGTEIIRRAGENWYQPPSNAQAELENALEALKGFLNPFQDLLFSPYSGTREQRAALRRMNSALIARYIQAIKIDPPISQEVSSSLIRVETGEASEIRVLKQIARTYIIHNPTLIAQQHGQRLIIRRLFNEIFENTGDLPPSFLPKRLADQFEPDTGKARFAADCIAELTENEAIALHARLTGASSGSVLDPIVR